MKDTSLVIASFRGHRDPAAAGQAGADREDAGESVGSDGRHQHAQPQTAAQEEGELILFCTIMSIVHGRPCLQNLFDQILCFHILT